MDIRRESIALVLLVKGKTLQAQVDLLVDQLHTRDEQIEKQNEKAKSMMEVL